MEEKFILTEFNITDVLDDIRKPNGNKKSNTKTFEAIVPVVWEKLGLEKTPNPAALEKLLVNLILNIYDVEKTEDIEKKRETAQNRDISLLMFGLLYGYYHTKEEDGKKVNVLSEERNESYLNDSDFIKLDYPGEGTYQEIKIKDKQRKIKSNSAQPRPLNKLTKIAGDCKKEIGINLYELIKTESYKEYTGNTETPVDLPKPYYTTKNFQPKNSKPECNPTDDPSGNNDITQEESEPIVTDGDTDGRAGLLSIRGVNPKKIINLVRRSLNRPANRKDIIGIFMFMLAAVVSIVAIVSLKNGEHSPSSAESANNPATENEALTITGITIYNADITLAPDKTWEHLQVAIYPREANIEDVNYYSDNVRLVTVNRSEEIVKLASGWSEETKRSTEVHVQFEEVDAKALVTVQENPIADSTTAPSESSLEGNDSANTERVSGF